MNLETVIKIEEISKRDYKKMLFQDAKSQISEDLQVLAEALHELAYTMYLSEDGGDDG